MFILKGGKEAMNYEETKSKLDKMWEKIKPWRALVDGEGAFKPETSEEIKELWIEYKKLEMELTYEFGQ